MTIDKDRQVTRSQSKVLDNNVDLELPRGGLEGVSDSSHTGSKVECCPPQTGIQSPVAVLESPDHDLVNMNTDLPNMTQLLSPQSSTPDYRHLHHDNSALDLNNETIPEEFLSPPHDCLQTVESLDTLGKSLGDCKLIDSNCCNSSYHHTQKSEPEDQTFNCKDCERPLGAGIWVECNICDFKQCTYCMTRTPHYEHLNFVRLKDPSKDSFMAQ